MTLDENERCLIFSEFGQFLGKHSERLVVRKGKDVLAEHPLMDLEQIIIAASGIGISSDLVEACVRRGITITLVDYSGRPYANLVSPALTATVRTRRAQLMAYNDHRGVEIARLFACGKIQNQRNLLRYFGKYRKQRYQEKFLLLQQIEQQIAALQETLLDIDAPQIEEVRSRLLNVEGRAAHLYWQGVQTLLAPGAGPLEQDSGFVGRTHRGATDPVNALINYGYGILYSQVWNALNLAGLEPFAGFLHADRSGKPSLVLDFIEEFRQPIVDRTVIALWNKGFSVEWETPDTKELAEAHVSKNPTPTKRLPLKKGKLGAEGSSEEAVADKGGRGRDGAKLAGTSEEPVEEEIIEQHVRLSATTRKAFAAKILERLEDGEPYEGKRRKIKHILQMQARHLATFLRGEGQYKPFVPRW